MLFFLNGKLRNLSAEREKKIPKVQGLMLGSDLESGVCPNPFPTSFLLPGEYVLCLCDTAFVLMETALVGFRSVG